MQWHPQLENGELLRVAEASGFDVMVTSDQNIRYQQNLTGRKLALVVLGSNIWPVVRDHGAAIAAKVAAATPGSYEFIEMPLPPKRRRDGGWTRGLCVTARRRRPVANAGERRMIKKYRSDAMAAIHETMEALHDVGAIDKQTMRRFDEACLTPIRPLKAEEIKAIREREHVSQTVFANYLNVTSSLVSKWERGEKRPSGASLKLLSLVEKNGLATVA